MAMMRSWRHAAGRACKGGAIALVALVLVSAPGPLGPTDAAGKSRLRNLIEKTYGVQKRDDHRDRHAEHAPAIKRRGARHHLETHFGREHDGRHTRDPLSFEGGVEVPRRYLRARFARGHGHWDEDRAWKVSSHERGDRHRHGHVGPAFRVKVRNLAPQAFDGPVILVIDAVKGRAEVHRPCGHLATGEPFICLMRSGTWERGAWTPKADIKFTGAKHVRFAWHVEAMPPSMGENAAPVADAGPDQAGFVGDTVTLDGSASSDLDGDPLDFTWTLDDAPPGSGAALSDPGAVNPTFALDLPGTYTLSLVVGDGEAVSAPDTVSVSTLNSPPVADAGPDQTVFVGDPVTLDGTGSFDVDGDPFALSWLLLSAPSGSAAALSDPTALMPGFTVDRAGTYTFELVADDGMDESAPDTVSVTTANSAPVADAGPDRTVTLGNVVTLDGAGSMDVDGDPLSFLWSIESAPTGSAAALDDPAAEAPTFTADLSGTYVVQLIVDDGLLSSTPDSVVFDTANARPTADAGFDQGTEAGDTVTLDGTHSSDPDSDPLGFFWAITMAPGGSAAVLDDDTSPTPSLVPDLAGDYLVQLIVDDGDLASAPDTVLVSVRPPPALSIDDVQGDEGDAGATTFRFTVTLSGPTSHDVGVDFATAGVTASGGLDYANAAGTLTIPAGETSATIDVDVLGDTIVEGDETFAVNLTAPTGATLGDAQGIGTILNDDVASLSIGDVTLTEGDSGTVTASFPVTLTGVLSTNVNIQFASADGTATAGSDYLATSGFMTIRAGRTSGVITMAVVGDTVAEPDETVFVNLLGAGTVPIADAQGVLTILDND